MSVCACVCVYEYRPYAHLLSFLVRTSIYTMITANDARISELDDSTTKAQTTTRRLSHAHRDTHTQAHANNNGNGNVNKKSHGEIGRSSVFVCL